MRLSSSALLRCCGAAAKSALAPSASVASPGVERSVCSFGAGTRSIGSRVWFATAALVCSSDRLPTMAPAAAAAAAGGPVDGAAAAAPPLGNPLLATAATPLWGQVRAEHALPAAEFRIAECKKTVEEVVAKSAAGGAATYASVCAPLFLAEQRLCAAMAPVRHLKSVVNDMAGISEAYVKCTAAVDAYDTWRNQHEGLFKAVEAVAAGADFASLSPGEQMSVSKTLREFKLNGLGLPTEAERQRFGAIKQRLTELETKCEDNILKSTMAWQKVIEREDELRGLSAEMVAAARARAEAKGMAGKFLVTLDAPSRLPVLLSCANRALREEVLRAQESRASAVGPAAPIADNAPLIAEMLRLRLEQAKLLGFANIAELSLAPKSAPSVAAVDEFLQSLVDRSRPKAQEELRELQEFAEEAEKEVANAEGAVGQQKFKLEPWDLSFYAEKLREARFSVSDDLLRPYFPLEKVLGALFEVIKRVYGVAVTEVKQPAEIWANEARLFEFRGGEGGELIGRLYVDLYARAHKRENAWMDEAQLPGVPLDGGAGETAAAACLTCNFDRPVGDTPALLSHRDVETLFHECGHCMHLLFTRVKAFPAAGVRVPWDAVEHPSQFHEGWCWEEEALRFMSGHYKTGEPLPEELLRKLLRAKHFQRARGLVRQLTFTLFDWELHRDFTQELAKKSDAEIYDWVMEKYRGVYARVSVTPPVEDSRFPNAFAHIFGGSYWAGYYSYLWAQVFAADSFAKFQETGIFNRETGKLFLDTVLSQGHSAEPLELFRRFRGREPKIDALLVEYGIQEEKP